MQVDQARVAVMVVPAQGTHIFAPAAGPLSLISFTPTATTASKLLSIPTGSVVLTGLVSDDGIGIAGVVVAMMQPELRYRPPPRAYYSRVPRSLLTEIGVPTGALTLVTVEPLIDTTGNIVLAILPGGLALGPNAPDLGGLVTEIAVPLASLGITGLFPTYTTTQSALIVPSEALLQLIGFPPVLPPGPISIGVPLAALLLLGNVSKILTERLAFHTPLGVIVLPHATTVMVLPYATTLSIL